jgi:hypothetical protein
MRLVSAVLAGLMIATTPVAIGNQQWTVLPGQAIGPLRLGMTAQDVVSLLGLPDSRDGDRFWTYQSAARLRIEFRDGRVRTLTTWDRRAVTQDGLRIGSSHGDVIRALGPNPETTITPTGIWVFRSPIGLGLFIERGVVTALVVMPSRAPAVVPEARPGPPPGPVVTLSPAQATPVIVIENLSHRVGCQRSCNNPQVWSLNIPHPQSRRGG